MNDALLYKNVAVAVIYDAPSDRFLLWNNKRWQGYAFPMKQMDPAADPQRAALAALDDRDMTLELSRATASPIDRLIETIISEGTRRLTVYDYHVYAVDLVASGDPDGGLRGDPTLHPDFRYFTYDQIVSATNVTKSTTDIARELIEDRKVAVAVVHRDTTRGKELLLVGNRDGEFFFPSTRMKTELLPAQAAARAVNLDLGYEGELAVPKQSEVPAVQTSRRFGTRQVRFFFHPCLVTLPGVNLTAPGNALEQAVNALQPPKGMEAVATGSQPYWGWFTEEELRTLPQISPSVAIVLNTVLQLVG